MKRKLILFSVHICLLSVSQLTIAETAERSDWPHYRGDVYRSGTVSENFSFPLKKIWSYNNPRVPQPAWPDPLKAKAEGRNRSQAFNFDHAPQPVIYQNKVFFGSSADDTLRALDIHSGKELWHFTAGGPIRFSPALDKENIYFGSDDGFLYCLEMTTGKLVWKFRGGPSSRKVLGNGRIISRWPLRNGILLDKGTIYFVAGMWPSEGVYLYALDAKSGAIRWCNDTSGAEFVSQPHSAFALTGIAPQGYLRIADGILLVPQGRSNPATYSLETGELIELYSSLDFRNSIIGSSVFKLRTDKGKFHIGPGKPRWGEKKLDFLHNANTAIVAGKNVLVGGSHVLAAYDSETGKEVWKESGLKGAIHVIAAGQGSVVVGTSTGDVICFSSQDVKTDLPAPVKVVKKAKLSSQAKELLAEYKKREMGSGWVVVVSETGASLAEEIATHTDFNVIGVILEKMSFKEERERLLASTDLYGSRLWLHTLEKETEIPFPRYFVNSVVVQTKLDSLPASELTRILRPCGGLMFFPDTRKDDLTKWVTDNSISSSEFTLSYNPLKITRGKLPGAFDWDSAVKADEHITWPLALTWFGGIGPSRAVDRHGYPMRPIPANGRYFYLGPREIIAVDAYNGTELWSKSSINYVPHDYTIRYQYTGLMWKSRKENIYGNYTSVSADDNYLYVNFGDVQYKLNAQTGEQEGVYGNHVKAGVGEYNKDYELVVDETHSGGVHIEEKEEYLEIKLKTKDPKLTQWDLWELYFDFRPHQNRRDLYGALGVFQIIVDIEKKKARVGVGSQHPDVTVVSEKPEELTVRLSYADIKKLLGTVPDNFAFGAVLMSCDNPRKKRPVRKHLFCDDYAASFNNGWAEFALKAGESIQSDMDTAHVASAEPIPQKFLAWPRMPKRDKKSDSKRLDPITGLKGVKTYRDGYGCTTPISSASIDFLRATTIGYYDYTSDSGVRHFGGIRPACGARSAENIKGSKMPALGVLISNEGSAGCTCKFSFQTSFALAPTRYPLHEDWGVFHSDIKPGTPVKHLSLNLGAPAEQRDKSGALWFGYPRPFGCAYGGFRKGIQFAVGVPFSLNGYSDFKAYRFSSDRVKIDKTDKPWVYASGYRGVRKAVVDLTWFSDDVSALSSDEAPIIDGELSDACWDGIAGVGIPGKGAFLYLRYDKENLYIGYREMAPLGADGKIRPFMGKAQKDDKLFWDDDALDIVLMEYRIPEKRRPPNEELMMHLGVSVTGARYDALYKRSLHPRNSRLKIKEVVVDSSWDGTWTSEVKVDKNMFTAEIAIPIHTLKDQGKFDMRYLGINIAQAGKLSEDAKRNYVFLTEKHHRVYMIDAETTIADPSGKFTVKLHFNEPDNLKPGDRVFDISLQGKTVLENVDIVKEAGGIRRALTKEFKGISAAAFIEVDFKAKTKMKPILSGIEIIREEQSSSKRREDE